MKTSISQTSAVSMFTIGGFPTCCAHGGAIIFAELDEEAT